MAISSADSGADFQPRQTFSLVIIQHLILFQVPFLPGAPRSVSRSWRGLVGVFGNRDGPLSLCDRFWKLWQLRRRHSIHAGMVDDGGRW